MSKPTPHANQSNGCSPGLLLLSLACDGEIWRAYGTIGTKAQNSQVTLSPGHADPYCTLWALVSIARISGMLLVVLLSAALRLYWTTVTRFMVLMMTEESSDYVDDNDDPRDGGHDHDDMGDAGSAITLAARLRLLPRGSI